MSGSKHIGVILALSLILILNKMEVFAQDATPLTPTQAGIAHIAIATAQGDVEHIEIALNKGLDAGLTANQVKEELVHLYAYCGFPRSLMAINTLTEVLNDRRENGVIDDDGEAGTAVMGTDKYEQGKQVLEELTGIPANGSKAGYAITVPIIEVFLKEHLFADIFKRGVLSYQEREIATLSALFTMGGLTPMASGHLRINLRLGLTEGQAYQILGMIEESVGKSRADEGRQILSAQNTQQQEATTETATSVDLFDRGELIEADVFTGNAWLNGLVTADEINDNSVGVVTFEKGARTYWHKHPSGQIILALRGKGFYQEQGGPKRILQKGDVVKCPENTPHWHGASTDEDFMQIAITGRANGPTQWLQEVTQAEYTSEN